MMNVRNKILTGLMAAVIALPAMAQSQQDGIAKLERNHFAEAKQIFNGLIVKEPGNASNYYYLGDVYMAYDNPDSAKIFYDKGLSVNSNEPLNYIGEAKVLLAKKNTSEAKGQLDKAISLAPKNAYIAQQVANAIIMATATELSDFAFQQANRGHDLDKKNLYYWITLGDAWRLKGEGGKGASEYENVQKTDSKFALAPLRLGELWTKVNNYDEAQKSFQTVIGIDANYSPVYRDLGELYYKMGKVDQAISSYKTYLDQVGHSPAERMRYASFLYLNKSYKEALEEMDKLVGTESSNFVLHRLMGYSYYETGEYDKGIAAMEKYFKIVKPDAIIPLDYEYYGRLLSKSGKDSMAVNTLRKAYELDSTQTEILETLAETYAHAKKYKEAADIMLRKMKKERTGETVNGKMLGNPQDYFTLGRYYYISSQYALADSAFKKVTEFFPTYAYGYLYRGRTNGYLDPDQKQGLAKPYYEQFIEKAQPDAAKYKKELTEAYYYLGSYYYKQKDNTNAKLYLNKVLELDPNHQQAKEIMKFLNKGK